MISSRNYAPSPKMLPFLRRHYAFDADLPETLELEDMLMADNAFVRIITRGAWSFWDGTNWVSQRGALLFGSNGRALKIKVQGPISVVSFAIRPSAWTALFDCSAVAFADRVAPLSEAWGDDMARALEKAVAEASHDADAVARIEEIVDLQMEKVGRSRVDPVIASFEAIARRDSTIKVDRAAEILGLSSRQLERRCLASFGLSPKAVLQRSRFLDMASAMRGLSKSDEAELASLRYFDQSHLNREFRRYTGMTPGAFQRSVTPLFTAILQLRVDGKELA